ncbi:hypothetical protein [Chryseobacterium sp. KMC2]
MILKVVNTLQIVILPNLSSFNKEVPVVVNTLQTVILPNDYNIG